MPELHPDVVRAISDLSKTSLGRRYNKFTKKTYGVSGPILAGKTVSGEFGGRSTKSGRGVVSSAGARGPAQFIASTRSDFIKQHGIDPWKGDAEAIKGLMIHQLTRGGLKGYNPGDPNYSKYILDQKIPREDRAALRGGSAGAPKPKISAPQTHTIPGQSFGADRQAARRALLMGGPINPEKLLAYKAQVNEMQDVPATKAPAPFRSAKSARSAASGTPSTSGTPGKIHEVFFDPIKEYWDEGAVRKGEIGDHRDHVHVSADKALAEELGRLAQGMGLNVSGQKKFGGTPTSGHTKGSFHYKDMGIDVSGDAAKMRKFAQLVMKKARNGRVR